MDMLACIVNCGLSQDSVSIAYMLTATNTFARRTATDCRRQLCRFGENLTNNLLHVWNNRPSDSLKVLLKNTKVCDSIIVCRHFRFCFQSELVFFFRLQIHIHHPRGAKTEAEGAYAVDWDKWKVRQKLFLSSELHSASQNT